MQRFFFLCVNQAACKRYLIALHHELNFEHFNQPVGTGAPGVDDVIFCCLVQVLKIWVTKEPM